MKAPNTVSFETLANVVRDKHGRRVARSMFDLYGEYKPGSGCPCDNCQKERQALINELREKVHADHKMMIERACPQRAAHDLQEPESESKFITATSSFLVPRLYMGFDPGGTE